MLATTEQPVEKLRLAFASGQRPVIQFLWTKVLHTDELFADLAAARARLVEYVSLAVVTLDDGTLEHDADLNFALKKKTVDHVRNGTGDQPVFRRCQTSRRG